MVFISIQRTSEGGRLARQSRETPTAHLYVRQLLQLGQSRQFHELAFHQFQHDRLLRMQPVLRLLIHQRPW